MEYETDYTKIIDWDKVKCPKCGGKKMFGKYTNKPYCIDCGTFYNAKTSQDKA